MSVFGDAIMNANAINAVCGDNNTKTLTSSVNDSSTSLVIFNWRDLTFVEVKLMFCFQLPTKFFFIQ